VLDLDPDEMNADPQPWLEYFYLMKKSAKVLVNPFGRQKTVLKT
jgi:hypothetical protein